MLFIKGPGKLGTELDEAGKDCCLRRLPDKAFDRESIDLRCRSGLKDAVFERLDDEFCKKLLRCLACLKYEAKASANLAMRRFKVVRSL